VETGRIVEGGHEKTIRQTMKKWGRYLFELEKGDILP
jgi:hypothetical protein